MVDFDNPIPEILELEQLFSNKNSTRFVLIESGSLGWI